MKICKVENCGREAVAYGCCQNHRRRMKRYGDPLGVSPSRHGMSGTYEFELWQNIRKKYPVCDHWLMFIDFYKDTGKRPAYGYHLKRIDEREPFGPDNFKWALKKERAKTPIDRRQTSKVYTSLSDVPHETIQAIYNSKLEGMSIPDLCTQYYVCTRLMLEIMRNR